jgi:hypothetical protein
MGLLGIVELDPSDWAGLVSPSLPFDRYLQQCLDLCLAVRIGYCRQQDGDRYIVAIDRRSSEPRINPCSPAVAFLSPRLNPPFNSHRSFFFPEIALCLLLRTNSSTGGGPGGVIAVQLQPTECGTPQTDLGSLVD